MLTTREAVRIGRRGGKKRMHSLSPELRSEIASWAQLIREQKRRGEVTFVEQRRRFIHLVHSEDPDLAALLKFLSRLPIRLAREIYDRLPAEQLALVDKTMDEVRRG